MCRLKSIKIILDELIDEGAYISEKVQALAQSLDTEATKDTAQTTAAFVLAPFTFGWSLGILEHWRAVMAMRQWSIHA